MSRHQTSFKSTQVFDWESEPADERPTDFGQSTNFSALSGYSTLSEPRPVSRRQREHRLGLMKLAGVGVVILSVCMVVVSQMAHLLHQ